MRADEEEVSKVGKVIFPSRFHHSLFLMGSHMNLQQSKVLLSWSVFCELRVPLLELGSSEGWSLTICSESSPCFKLVNLLPWPCRPSPRHTESVASRSLPVAQALSRCVVSASVVAACVELSSLVRDHTNWAKQILNHWTNKEVPTPFYSSFSGSVAHRVTILKMPTLYVVILLKLVGWHLGSFSLSGCCSSAHPALSLWGLAVLSDVAQASSPAVLGSKSGHSRSLMLVSSWEKSAGTHC